MRAADDRADIFVSFPPRYSISNAVGIMMSVGAGVISHEHPEVKKRLFTHLFDTFPVYHLSTF